MDKLKAFYRKYQSQLTISMNKRPIVMTLLWLFLINMIILTISAVIAKNIAPDHYSSFLEAFAQGSIRWMISPNSILYLEGNSELMLLAGSVVVIEIVLFSGTIIAMTTSSLRDYFTKTGQAKGRLILINHIIILNYNSKVCEIIIDLMQKEEKVVVLLLSDKDKEYVKNQIHSSLVGKNIRENRLDLVVRQGDPFSRSELDDVSITDAKSIVIMSQEGLNNNNTNEYNQTDLNALKLLLLVGSFPLVNDCNIVVEVDEHKTVCLLDDLSKTVDSLKNKMISSISFNRKLGHILAQTVFQPNLASVYMDLLSFKGDEFYSTKSIPIEDYLEKYTDSIPIVNYDKLYILTNNSKRLHKKRFKPYYTDRRLIRAIPPCPPKINLFILGESRKKEYILENLKRMSNENFRMKCYNRYDVELPANIKQNSSNIILILSDDSVSPDNYDANVFCTLISLHKDCSKDSASLITEILDPRNLDSITDFRVNNAIVSNQLVSFIIAQMISNAGSKEFYDALLLIDNCDKGFDIKIENVEDLLDMNQNLSFTSKTELVNCIYYSLDKEYMIIGIMQNEKVTYLNNDMDKSDNIKLMAGDKLILIKY